MITREITGHLCDLYGIDVTPDLISTVTDAVADRVATWQQRPLEPVYPLVFFDAIHPAKVPYFRPQLLVFQRQKLPSRRRGVIQ